MENLNASELDRQKNNAKEINDFINQFKRTIRTNSDSFLKDLAKTNEFLLLKFDDILCVDDVNKHGRFSINIFHDLVIV